MKIMKEEVREFSRLDDQKRALTEMLGLLREQHRDLWKRIIKKYKLDKDKLWTLDRKTRKIIEVF